MRTIILMSGSTLGGAEALTEELACSLEQLDYKTAIFHGPYPHEISFQGVWLLVTSTHGAGSLPDNFLPLFDYFHRNTPDLSHVHYGAIGLGDNSYNTFCQGIKYADRLLTQCAAHRVGSRLEIDVATQCAPEQVAKMWLVDWLTKITHILCA